MAKILYEVKQNQNQYNAGYGPIILWQWYALTNEKAGSTQKKSLPVFLKKIFGKK